MVLGGKPISRSCSLRMNPSCRAAIVAIRCPLAETDEILDGFCHAAAMEATVAGKSARVAGRLPRSATNQSRLAHRLPATTPRKSEAPPQSLGRRWFRGSLGGEKRRLFSGRYALVT